MWLHSWNFSKNRLSAYIFLAHKYSFSVSCCNGCCREEICYSVFFVFSSSSTPRMHTYKRTSSPRSPTNTGELFTPAHEENVRFIHDSKTRDAPFKLSAIFTLEKCVYTHDNITEIYKTYQMRGNFIFVIVMLCF